MTNRSTFPSQIDQFEYLSEVLASDKTNVERYQLLTFKENRTAEEDTELANLKTTLANKIISSESFNKMFDCIVNLETFFKNDVETYLSTLEVGALRSDLGLPENLTTVEKSNVVGAINEVQSEVDVANSKVGNLQDLPTSDKDSIVEAISEHVLDTENPHEVTAAQVGAYTTAQSDSRYRLKSEQKYLAWYKTTLGKTLSPSTWTRLTYNLSKVNEGSMFNSSSNTFTIKETGYYKFSANALVHTQPTKGIYLEVWQIGTSAKHNIINVFSSGTEGWNYVNGQGIIYCTQGQEFEFVILQGSSDNRPLNDYNVFVEKI